MPLAPSAERLLEWLPGDEDNPWVIAGWKPGSHLTDLQHAWRRIRARAEFDSTTSATSDTTFGDPLDTVEDIVGGTGGQLAAAFAVDGAQVGLLLRFNATQQMGAVGVGVAADTGFVTGLVERRSCDERHRPPHHLPAPKVRQCADSLVTSQTCTIH